MTFNTLLLRLLLAQITAKAADPFLKDHAGPSYAQLMGKTHSKPFSVQDPAVDLPLLPYITDELPQLFPASSADHADPLDHWPTLYAHLLAKQSWSRWTKTKTQMMDSLKKITVPHSQRNTLHTWLKHIDSIRPPHISTHAQDAAGLTDLTEKTITLTKSVMKKATHHALWSWGLTAGQLLQVTTTTLSLYTKESQIKHTSQDYGEESTQLAQHLQDTLQLIHFTKALLPLLSPLTQLHVHYSGIGYSMCCHFLDTLTEPAKIAPNQSLLNSIRKQRLTFLNHLSKIGGLEFDCESLLTTLQADLLTHSDWLTQHKRDNKRFQNDYQLIHDTLEDLTKVIPHLIQQNKHVHNQFKHHFLAWIHIHHWSHVTPTSLSWMPNEWTTDLQKLPNIAAQLAEGLYHDIRYALSTCAQTPQPSLTALTRLCQWSYSYINATKNSETIAEFVGTFIHTCASHHAPLFIQAWVQGWCMWDPHTKKCLDFCIRKGPTSQLSTLITTLSESWHVIPDSLTTSIQTQLKDHCDQETGWWNSVFFLNARAHLCRKQGMSLPPYIWETLIERLPSLEALPSLTQSMIDSTTATAQHPGLTTLLTQITASNHPDTSPLLRAITSQFLIADQPLPPECRETGTTLTQLTHHYTTLFHRWCYTFTQDTPPKTILHWKTIWITAFKDALLSLFTTQPADIQRYIWSTSFKHQLLNALNATPSDLADHGVDILKLCAHFVQTCPEARSFFSDLLSESSDLEWLIHPFTTTLTDSHSPWMLDGLKTGLPKQLTAHIPVSPSSPAPDTPAPYTPSEPHFIHNISGPSLWTPVQHFSHIYTDAWSQLHNDTIDLQKDDLDWCLNTLHALSPIIEMLLPPHFFAPLSLSMTAAFTSQLDTAHTHLTKLHLDLEKNTTTLWPFQKALLTATADLLSALIATPTQKRSKRPLAKVLGHTIALSIAYQSGRTAFLSTLSHPELIAAYTATLGTPAHRLMGCLDLIQTSFFTTPSPTAMLWLDTLLSTWIQVIEKQGPTPIASTSQDHPSLDHIHTTIALCLAYTNYWTKETHTLLPTLLESFMDAGIVTESLYQLADLTKVKKAKVTLIQSHLTMLNDLAQLSNEKALTQPKLLLPLQKSLSKTPELLDFLSVTNPTLYFKSMGLLDALADSDTLTSAQKKAWAPVLSTIAPQLKKPKLLYDVNLLQLQESLKDPHSLTEWSTTLMKSQKRDHELAVFQQFPFLLSPFIAGLQGQTTLSTPEKVHHLESLLLEACRYKKKAADLTKESIIPQLFDALNQQSQLIPSQVSELETHSRTMLEYAIYHHYNPSHLQHIHHTIAQLYHQLNLTPDTALSTQSATFHPLPQGPIPSSLTLSLVTQYFLCAWTLVQHHASHPDTTSHHETLIRSTLTLGACIWTWIAHHHSPDMSADQSAHFLTTWSTLIGQGNGDWLRHLIHHELWPHSPIKSALNQWLAWSTHHLPWHQQALWSYTLPIQSDNDAHTLTHIELAITHTMPLTDNYQSLNSLDEKATFISLFFQAYPIQALALIASLSDYRHLTLPFIQDALSTFQNSESSKAAQKKAQLILQFTKQVLGPCLAKTQLDEQLPHNLGHLYTPTLVQHEKWDALLHDRHMATKLPLIAVFQEGILRQDPDLRGLFFHCLRHHPDTIDSLLPLLLWGHTDLLNDWYTHTPSAITWTWQALITVPHFSETLLIQWITLAPVAAVIQTTLLPHYTQSLSDLPQFLINGLLYTESGFRTCFAHLLPFQAVQVLKLILFHFQESALAPAIHHHWPLIQPLIEETCLAPDLSSSKKLTQYEAIRLLNTLSDDTLATHLLTLLRANDTQVTPLLEHTLAHPLFLANRSHPTQALSHCIHILSEAQDLSYEIEDALLHISQDLQPDTPHLASGLHALLNDRKPIIRTQLLTTPTLIEEDTVIANLLTLDQLPPSFSSHHQESLASLLLDPQPNNALLKLAQKPLFKAVLGLTKISQAVFQAVANKVLHPSDALFTAIQDAISHMTSSQLMDFLEGYLSQLPTATKDQALTWLTHYSHHTDDPDRPDTDSAWSQWIARLNTPYKRVSESDPLLRTAFTTSLSTTPAPLRSHPSFNDWLLELSKPISIDPSTLQESLKLPKKTSVALVQSLIAHGLLTPLGTLTTQWIDPNPSTLSPILNEVPLPKHRLQALITFLKEFKAAAPNTQLIATHWSWIRSDVSHIKTALNSLIDSLDHWNTPLIHNLCIARTHYDALTAAPSVPPATSSQTLWAHHTNWLDQLYHYTNTASARESWTHLIQKIENSLIQSCQWPNTMSFQWTLYLLNWLYDRQKRLSYTLRSAIKQSLTQSILTSPIQNDTGLPKDFYKVTDILHSHYIPDTDKLTLISDLIPALNGDLATIIGELCEDQNLLPLFFRTFFEESPFPILQTCLTAPHPFYTFFQTQLTRWLTHQPVAFADCTTAMSDDLLPIIASILNDILNHPTLIYRAYSKEKRASIQPQHTLIPLLVLALSEPNTTSQPDTPTHYHKLLTILINTATHQHAKQPKSIQWLFHTIAEYGTLQNPYPDNTPPHAHAHTILTELMTQRYIDAHSRITSLLSPDIQLYFPNSHGNLALATPDIYTQIQGQLATFFRNRFLIIDQLHTWSKNIIWIPDDPTTPTLLGFLTHRATSTPKKEASATLDNGHYQRLLDDVILGCWTHDASGKSLISNWVRHLTDPQFYTLINHPTRHAQVTKLLNETYHDSRRHLTHPLWDSWLNALQHTPPATSQERYVQRHFWQDMLAKDPIHYMNVLRPYAEVLNTHLYISLPRFKEGFSRLVEWLESRKKTTIRHRDMAYQGFRLLGLGFRLDEVIHLMHTFENECPGLTDTFFNQLHDLVSSPQAHPFQYKSTGTLDTPFKTVLPLLSMISPGQQMGVLPDRFYALFYDTFRIQNALLYDRVIDKYGRLLVQDMATNPSVNWDTLFQASLPKHSSEAIALTHQPSQYAVKRDKFKTQFLSHIDRHLMYRKFNTDLIEDLWHTLKSIRGFQRDTDTTLAQRKPLIESTYWDTVLQDILAFKADIDAQALDRLASPRYQILIQGLFAQSNGWIADQGKAKQFILQLAQTWPAKKAQSLFTLFQLHNAFHVALFSAPSHGITDPTLQALHTLNRLSNTKEYATMSALTHPLDRQQRPLSQLLQELLPKHTTLAEYIQDHPLEKTEIPKGKLQEVLGSP